MSEELPPEVSKKIVEYLNGRLAAEFNGEVVDVGEKRWCVIEVLVDHPHMALVRKIQHEQAAAARIIRAVWLDWYPGERGVALLDVVLQGGFEIPLTFDVSAETPRDWAITLGSADGLALRFLDVREVVENPPTLTSLDVPIKPLEKGTTLSDIDYWLRDNSDL